MIRLRYLAACTCMAGAIVSPGIIGCALSGANRRAVEPVYVFEPLSAQELAAVQYPNLREELLFMVTQDQLARTGQHPTSGDREETVTAAIQRIDAENTKRMHTIVGEVGWPTRSKVGSDGAQAAWLLVQHADQDVHFQRRCLKLMEAELAHEEVYPGNVAYLTDRVRVNEGKEQEYGTQFHRVNGKLEPRPIRDVKNVDTRRSRMGLSTLDEYKEMMKT